MGNGDEVGCARHHTSCCLSTSFAGVYGHHIHDQQADHQQAGCTAGECLTMPLHLPGDVASTALSWRIFTRELLSCPAGRLYTSHLCICCSYISSNCTGCLQVLAILLELCSAASCVSIQLYCADTSGRRVIICAVNCWQSPSKHGCCMPAGGLCSANAGGRL